MPGTTDVNEIPPEVAVLSNQFIIMTAICRPAAAVDHGSIGLVEVVAELRVAGVPVSLCGMAAVHLDVVHLPLGEGLGVGLEVAQAAGVAATCFGSWAAQGK